MQSALNPTKSAKGESAGAQDPLARNTAVDAYRGLVMLLMMAEMLQFAAIAQAFPASSLWNALAFLQTHVEWEGCSLHDLIQPSFSFLVGVALPYSLASRMAKGELLGRLFRHTLRRSFLLIALGIALRVLDDPERAITFEDTLTQIGLGYPFLVLLGLQSPRWQWSAFVFLLLAYWLAWALYPMPGQAFDFQAAGIPPDWSHHASGFAAHWNKNINFGTAFDRWFLNLFPRSSPYVANADGYVTLNFIPTLATMILGLAAGRWLRSEGAGIPLGKFLSAGSICMGSGLLLHFTNLCPIVKRIWTPSWTLFSGGACFVLLALLSWIIVVRGHRGWSRFLVVIGMNSMAAYLIAQLGEQVLKSRLVGGQSTQGLSVFTSELGPLVQGALVLFVYWLILFWMYRRKLFLKI